MFLVIQIFNKLLTELTGFNGFLYAWNNYVLRWNARIPNHRSMNRSSKISKGGGGVGGLYLATSLPCEFLRSLNWCPEHPPSPIWPPLDKIRAWIHVCFHYFSILDNFTNNFKNIQFRIILIVRTGGVFPWTNLCGKLWPSKE